MDVELTKEANYLICSLYKTYLQDRANGKSKSEAKSTGSSAYIQQEIFPNWSLKDVDETCRELDRAGLLCCDYADDVVWVSRLSDTAIIYMENRFKNKVDAVMDYIAKIKSMIPFI